MNPNPIATPADLPDWFDNVYEAVHMHQYYGLASLLLFGLLYGVKTLSKRAPATSKLGLFLQSDRGSMLLLLLTSLIGGAATAIGKGAKIDGPLVWTALKTAGGASFIFAIVFKLLFPKDKTPLPAPLPGSLPANPTTDPPLPVPGILPPVSSAAGVTTPSPSVPPIVKNILLLIGIGAALAACKCWVPTDPAYNSTGCVVARGAVNCGEQIGGAVLAGVLSQLPAVTSDGVLSSLEGQEGPAAGCLLSDVTTALAGAAGSNATISAPTPLYQSAVNHRDRWLLAHKMPLKTQFCFGKVCR